MDGAIGLDPSLLRGRRFVNLDSEDEGIFTTGCAGGVRVVAAFDRNEIKAEGKEAVIRLSGGMY